MYPPSASFQVTGIPNKGVCTLLWCPSFCSCYPGDTNGLPGSGPVGLIFMGPTGLEQVGKTVLNHLLSLHPRAHLQRPQTEIHPQSSHERGVLPYLCSCDQSGRLPITHTFQGRLQSSPETRETRGTIFVLSVVPFRVISVSKKRACRPVWYLGFGGCHSEDTALDSPTPVLSGAYVYRFNGTVANKEAVFNWLSPQGSLQREQTEMSISPVFP